LSGPVYDPYALKIYTDGSALRNPGGPGGIAGIAEFPDALLRENEVVFARGYRSTTNNRMELRACIEALKYISREKQALGIGRAIIITDSRYVRDNSRRAPYWRDGGRANDAGEPVANSDLWRDFLRSWTTAGVRVEVCWAAGKSTAVSREVDRAAKHAARNPTEHDVGFVPGTVARRRTPGKSAATPFPADAQVELIRIYRIQPRKALGVRLNRVVFDLYSTSSQAYVAVHYAHISVEHEIHRNHCYEVQFNRDKCHPRIESLRDYGPCP
jgi:ribonuclease HI